MVEKVLVLNAKNFKEITSKGTIIIDFYADWCGPCKMMDPEFEKAASKISTVKFAKVNIEGNQEIAMKYGVMSIPTLVILKNELVKDMHTGALKESEIIKFVEKYK
ncbi:thioredoxin [Candidatus Pacearchaeota archaeon]|nr:thioredoxin [Candidatus Pacearchaeota archaeon]